MTSVLRVRSVEQQHRLFKITGTLRGDELGWICLWTQDQWQAAVCDSALRVDRKVKAKWHFDGKYKTLDKAELVGPVESDLPRGA